LSSSDPKNQTTQAANLGGGTSFLGTIERSTCMKIIPTEPQKCKPENLKSGNLTTPQAAINYDRLSQAMTAALRILRDNPTIQAKVTKRGAK
jgi:hypothetical protein